MSKNPLSSHHAEMFERKTPSPMQEYWTVFQRGMGNLQPNTSACVQDMGFLDMR